MIATYTQELAVTRAVIGEIRKAKVPAVVTEALSANWLMTTGKLHIGIRVPAIIISRKAKQRLIQRLPKILGAAYQAANASGYYGPINLHRNLLILLGDEK